MTDSIFDSNEILSLLSSAKIGLWRMEIFPDGSRKFYADHQMGILLGIADDVSPEERLSIFGSRVHPEDQDVFAEYDRRLRANNRAEIVYRYIHPDLGTMYVRCSGKVQKSTDEMTVVEGLHQDMSDTVRVEKEIHRKAYTKFTEALLHDCTYFYEFDVTDGYIRKPFHISGEYDPFFGEKITFPIRYNNFNALRCDLFGFVANTEKEEKYWTVEGLLEAFSKGKQSVEIRYESEDMHLSWSATIILTEDERDHHVNAVYICNNVTELVNTERMRKRELEKALRQAQQASEAKTNFLFNMSHDIRTPMNAIIGFTDLLKSSLDNREQAEMYIGKIQTSNEFLLSLINNVLEMARIESGKIKLDESIWSAEQFRDTLRSVFSAQFTAKNITFEQKLNVEKEAILCDITKVRQIFLNILSNSLKYTNKGGAVTMEITQIEPEKEGYVTYSNVITDNGVGMSPDFLPHIFEEFSREQSSTDSGVTGTGLGMPIVKKLVDLMGGTIEVESEEGKGTTFTVILSFKRAQVEDKIDSLQVQEEYSKEIFEGKRILLAEDNELNAEIAKTVLERAGFIVEHAENGKIALSKVVEAEENYYDLILMDIQMPVQNGYEATRAIRMLPEVRKASLPIIAMTANAFEEDRRNAFEAGMNAHIAKPFKVPQLLKTIYDEIKDR